MRSSRCWRVPSAQSNLSDASDLIDLDSLLSDDGLALRGRVREFVDSEIRPHIAEWFDRTHFPSELVPELGRLGLLGMQLEG